MENIEIGKSGVLGSRIALGCMRINLMSEKQSSELLTAALENGINFFDHADIYGGGQSEKVFAGAVKACAVQRKDLILQSKCGIKKGMYDFSYAHIMDSVHQSLDRLGTDYLDFLLLHRPDTLMEAEDVAKAFDKLESEKAVRNFGVSNFHKGQVELLSGGLKQKICVNQLQLGLMFTGMIDFGMNVNMKNPMSVSHDDGILEYSRINNITIQAWSPFQFGHFEGVFVDNDKFPELNEELKKLGARYGVSSSAIAIAWILRHPAKIQPIIGTTNPSRVSEIAKADRVELTREEWYALYRAAGNKLP